MINHQSQQQHGDEPIQSTAAIAGHPIHPMFVLFPAAFLVGALATDIAYASVLDPMWASFSFWLIVAGLVTGIVAAAVGMIDFWTIDRARSVMAGWVHMVGNGIVLLLAAVSLGFRWVEPVGFVIPWGLVISTAIAVLLLITGWYGGELAYRHRIGVIEHHGPATVPFPREEQQRRSA